MKAILVWWGSIVESFRVGVQEGKTGVRREARRAER